MNKTFPYKETLVLKKGSKVMLINNINVEEGFVNGSQGEVLDLDENSVLVRFRNGKTQKFGRSCWKSEDDEDMIISQIPFVLCWAVSIHKIQGATLDTIDVDIGNGIFEFGQAYVALSRVKSLDGLFISSFNPTKIKIHPEVKEFYDNLIN